MDLLSILSYTQTIDFSINIQEIKFGCMDVHIRANGLHYKYWSYYPDDPLNQLLEAAVKLFIDGNPEGNNSSIDSGPRPRYEFVFFDLEGYDCTWLFKYIANELTVIIWDGNVSDRDTLLTLAENHFESEAFEVYILNKLPDFQEDLKFALKCDPGIFVHVLINAVCGLQHLEHYDDDNWGFRYSQEDYDKLIEWSATRERELL